SSTNRAVHITQTSSNALVIAIHLVIYIRKLRAISVEGVTNAELEAREVGGLVHNHVVPTNGISRTEDITRISLTEASTEGAGYVTKVLGSDVGLTTQVQTAPAVALQTDSSMTTKQTALRVIAISSAIVVEGLTTNTGGAVK